MSLENSINISNCLSISQSDFGRLCRTCMVDPGDIQSLIPITQKYSLSEFDNIMDMFNFCTSVQMRINDGLPSNICLSCVQAATTACLFKKQCQYSQNSFMEILKQISKYDKNTPLACSFHSCSECNKVFLSQNDVNLHFSDVHRANIDSVHDTTKLTIDENLTRKECGYCKRIFDSKTDLETHIQNHIELKNNLELQTTDEVTLKYEENPVYAEKLDELEDDSVDDPGNYSDTGTFLKDEIKEKDTIPYIKEVSLKSYFVKRQKKQKRILNKPHICEHCSEGFCKASSLAVHVRTKHTKERIYKCDKCDKTYAVNRDLNRHLKTHTDMYKCDICDKVFAFRQTLQIHLRAHTRSGIVTCDRCDQQFKDEKLLERHIKITHSGETHKCPNCDKQFSHVTKLRTHMKSHNPDSEKRLQCKFCPKRFNFVHHLRNHERTHTGARPFLCNKCGRGFTQSHYLTVHMRQHDEVQPYPCEYCGKSFCQPQRLQRHMRMHTGEKPFMCNVCGKRFSANVTLKRHLESHQQNENGQNPGSKSSVSPDQKPRTRKNRNSLAKQENSVCCVCNEAFEDPNSLALHMRTHARTHTCEVCSKGFTLASTLKSHVKTHSGNMRMHSCEVCSKKFSRPEHLKCHIRRAHSDDRPHVCGICKRGFCQSGELTIHMRRHTGEKPYLCVYCDKGFPTSSALKIHIRSHTGERPYKCGICTRAFTTSSSLLSHMNTHTAKAGDKNLQKIKQLSQVKNSPKQDFETHNIDKKDENSDMVRDSNRIDIINATDLSNLNNYITAPIMSNDIYTNSVMEFGSNINIVGANVDVQMVSTNIHVYDC